MDLGVGGRGGARRRTKRRMERRADGQEQLAAAPAEAPAAAPAEVDVAAELQKFADLKEKGLITEEEYNTKKAELLA